VTVTAPARGPLLDDLAARMARGEGFAVATLNLDHVVKLDRDPAFREAYLAQTHVTADGNPIVWLSRLAGDRVDLVPGCELVEPVAALAARHGVKVALVGSTEASLEAAAAALVRRYPGLEIALKLAPPMGFDPDGPAADAVIAAIRESGARLCYLALGAPKQERLAALAREALPEVGFLSIGAGLDFLSGAQRRAPRLARALAAEWIWRLATDPVRLGGRYAACIAVLPGLARRALAARREEESA
jgi:exopolysaccharide biosynthesis WecB/TagA/CpsF family protein